MSTFKFLINDVKGNYVLLSMIFLCVIIGYILTIKIWGKPEPNFPIKVTCYTKVPKYYKNTIVNLSEINKDSLSPYGKFAYILTEALKSEKYDTNAPRTYLGKKFSKLSKYIGITSDNSDKAKFIDKYKVEIKRSAGSHHTISQIETRKSSNRIGLAQADVIFHYLEGNHPQFPNSRRDSDVRGIAKVFKEWFLVTVPPEVFCSNSIVNNCLKSDDNPLNGTIKVHPGNRGSGTLVTAMNVKNYLQYKWKEGNNNKSLKLKLLEPDSSQIDSGYHVSGIEESSSVIISNLFPNIYSQVSSKNFEKEFKTQLISNKKFHFTIAVDAILIGNSEMSDTLIEDIQKIFRQVHSSKVNCMEDTLVNRIILEIAENTTFSEESLDNKFGNFPIASHKYLLIKGINPFFRQVLTIASKKFLIILPIILLLSILGISLIKQAESYSLSNKKFKKIIWMKLIGRAFFNIIIVLVILCIIAFVVILLIWTTEFYYFNELADGNEELITGSFWKIAKGISRFLFIQELDIPIYSSISYIILGLFQLLYASSITILFIYVVTIIAKLLKNIPRKMSKYIIIGWNTRYGAEIIDELTKFEIDFIIFGIEPRVKNLQQYEKHYIECTDLKSQIKKYKNVKSIIVLADKNWSKSEHFQDVDLWVIKTVELIANLFASEFIRIVAEVESKVSEALAKNNGAHEVVCSKSLGINLLLHSLNRPLLSEVYSNLLSTDESGNEIYYDRIEHRKTEILTVRYEDLKKIFEKCHKGRIVIGYLVNNSKVCLNPLEEEDCKLEIGSSKELRLIVIAKNSLDKTFFVDSANSGAY